MFFSQVRLGRDRERFRFHKFRMLDPDSAGEDEIAPEGDLAVLPQTLVVLASRRARLRASHHIEALLRKGECPVAWILDHLRGELMSVPERLGGGRLSLAWIQCANLTSLDATGLAAR